MKKCLMAVLLVIVVFCTAVSAADYPDWENPRKVNEEGYEIPYMEEGNPFVTHYAPWLRNYHMLSDYDVEHGVIGGEACQYIRAFDISPVNPDIMYFGTNTSGVYKTTTRGEHWYNITGNAAGHDVWGVLCDPFDADTVYVTMRKTGTHRSRDGGKTWHQIVLDLEQSAVISRSNTLTSDASGDIYITAGTGVYKLDYTNEDRTEDEVKNLFSRTDPVVGNIASAPTGSGALLSDIKVSPDGMRIYASAKSRGSISGGIYYSENGGKTWQIIGEEGKYTNEVTTIALHPELPDRIYAAMNRTNNETGEKTGNAVFISEDNGNTWTEVCRYTVKSNGTAVHRPFYEMKFGPKEDHDLNPSTPKVYPMYVCLSPTNYPHRVSYDEGKTGFSAKSNYIYSADDKLGYGSARQGQGYAHGWSYAAFAVDKTQPGRLVIPVSGIYEYDKFEGSGDSTLNESKFRRVSGGFSGASVMDIAFDSKGKMFLNVVDSGSWIQDKNGGIYDGVNYPTFLANVDDFFIHSVFDPNDDNHIISFIGHANGYGTYSGIRQSYDGGVTFKPMNEDAKLLTAKPPLTDESVGYPDDGEEGEDFSEDTVPPNYEWAIFGNAQVLCYDLTDKNIIYSSYHTSHDNGQTWTENTYYIAAIHPKNTKRQLGFEKNGEDAVFIHLTEDGGQTWERIMSLNVSNVQDIKFDLNDPNYVWYTATKSFCKIDLKDKSVKSLNSLFAYAAFNEIGINPKDPNHMLVGSSPGSIPYNMKNDFKVSESLDGGKTWHTVPGFWGSSINRFIFSKNTNEVFVGTMAGTFIYDYEKFNYYSLLKLIYGDKVHYMTVPRINMDGENVNNGEFVIAPSDVFYPRGKKLVGWEKDNLVYETGVWIPVSE